MNTSPKVLDKRTIVLVSRAPFSFGVTADKFATGFSYYNSKSLSAVSPEG